jgi:hypothetical protein
MAFDPIKASAFAICAFSLTACGGTSGRDLLSEAGRIADRLNTSQEDDPDIDRGFDAHPLSTMRPSIWIDPFGCEHWIIDDGVEGYLMNRLNRDGTPRCRD